MRPINVFLPVAAVLIAAVLWWSLGTPTPTTPEVAAPVADPAPAQDAADAAADAAAIATDAAAEAARTAETPQAQDAAAEAEAAADAALDAADRAADAAAQAAGTLPAQGTAPLADAAAAAQDAADATRAAADAAQTAAQIEAALPPEGFDLARVQAIIDGAAIPEAQKATLRTLVERSQSNPALLTSALEQVRAVMK